MPQDNYVITGTTIKEPPVSFYKKLKFLGPGLILSASIVGSGELIATTTLGARAGFIAFWIIILSCLVKVAVQLEFGKKAILSGQTAMSSFNLLPGPRIGKSNWAVWIIFILTSLKIVQVGGILGAASIVMHLLFPWFPTYAAAFLVAIVTSAMIYRGFYQTIEKVSLVMIVGFTIATLSAVYMIQFTPFSFTWSEMAEGIKFKFPTEIVAVAFGAFGITGVGADEIIAYNYWCLEKGYAAYTGPRDESGDWKKRAEGWISVMYLDALIAMTIYTIVTAAFFVLGAAILHGSAIIPEGTAVIENLALIYTQTLGPGAKTAYLIGAFFVLFSSVFASLAAWTRLYSDLFGQFGWIDFFNKPQRKKVVSWLAWILPMLWVMMFLFIKLPVFMILSGGIIGSVMLFLVVFAAIHFRNNRVKTIPSGLLYHTAFFISVISIISIGVYGLIQLFWK